MTPLTDQNFKSHVLEAKGLILIDFWAPWCAPCKALMPVLENALKDLEDKVTAYSLNIEDNPEAPTQHNVMSIPTLMLFKNGEPLDVRVGSQSEVDLKEWILSHV